MNRDSICRDCAFGVIDPKRSCWDYCEGRYRPGTKIKRKPTVYRTDDIRKAYKLLRLLQIDDVLIVDEGGGKSIFRKNIWRP